MIKCLYASIFRHFRWFSSSGSETTKDRFGKRWRDRLAQLFPWVLTVYYTEIEDWLCPLSCHPLMIPLPLLPSFHIPCYWPCFQLLSHSFSLACCPLWHLARAMGCLAQGCVCGVSAYHIPVHGDNCLPLDKHTLAWSGRFLSTASECL